MGIVLRLLEVMGRFLKGADFSDACRYSSRLVHSSASV
ncbi:hypothetical protein B005_1456 [Nocardiopsis alba ATCC BAA-2165]|uniref:Uncharacterized protein n=1 Tax=Nocardiopsis alba (strain ATCC BAA-2165 / BE74) TaxID=1205910 RepID=J7KWY6_NOCAA|nr:hypothetical protein B005_1456 [Nocardiopsis alba ATCC BAA-2165]